MIVGKQLPLSAAQNNATNRGRQNDSFILSQVLSDLPVAMALLSKSGKIVLCNKYFATILQTDKEELIGQPFFKRFALSAQLQSQAQFNELKTLALNPELPTNLMYKGKNKEMLISLKVTPVKKTAERPSYYIAILEDITELEETKNHLSHALTRYETVMQATKDAIWDYNIKTGESYYNQAIHEIFGYSENDIKDNNEWWKSNIHPDDKLRVLKKISSIITSDTSSWQDEYRFRCANGEYKIIEDRCIILRDYNGKARRIIGAMSDLTDKKTALLETHEQELYQKTELARGIIEAQEIERKRISEELHDNVNQMLATVKMIIDQAKNNDSSNKLLLQKCSKYLNDAISELRNIAHNLSSAWLDRHGLEIAIMKMVGMLKNIKTISVDIDIDHLNEDSLSAHTKLIIFRILQEQIQNILKHSKATKISIVIKNGDGRGFIRIADNGMGAKSIADCEGIGLRNMRNRIELLSGKMDIITAPGRGFSMEIEF